MDEITLGGGCFWCVEAALLELEGVTSVTSGYAGGHTEEPTYRAVCSGTTGHAEVVQVQFDPAVLSLRQLLTVFMQIHDPTQKDRQGPDVGSQYRSIILVDGDEQRATAESVIAAQAAHHSGSIQTELTTLETFYPAESHHQRYFEKNPGDAYCRMHAAPKQAKVRDQFADLV
ncbi:MAG: peptide-methionine (S)-S-oxide reductase MsrA [Haloquadratum sp.]|jgi:peptide-methionine (S)-S-oxide reductase|nr:peptide-methionine (S)-S-oxide reductase MsrA [Haloferacaceae archaeon]MDR9445249.1 peptide-methionine (S)-S-oxide reductase MsrA [Haloquadratum sp.]